FFPHLHSDVSLEKLYSAPLLTFSATPENEYLLFLKRLFDVAFSAFLLVILSPVYWIVAVLVKLTTPGPVIYSQIRCGLNGRRFRMKPGLTCLWALEGRSELDFRRWMRLDIDYIEQWSLLLDFKILCRTIPRVLSGRGAS